MCTLVETPDVSILIDAGASLGRRFGLLPHPKEYEALRQARSAIAQAASSAHIITASHYHYDHYTAAWSNVDAIWTWSSRDEAERIYSDKILLVKDWRKDVNPSQRKRGWIFQEIIKDSSRQFLVADGQSFRAGDTVISFSRPVPHGEEDTQLGWTLITTISRDGGTLVHASDIQGPILDSTAKLLLDSQPQTLIIGGPPLYLSDYKIGQESLSAALSNLISLAKRIPLMILDHHLLRAENWREYCSPVFEAARASGHRVLTAAEFAEQPERELEHRRRSLYESEPPSKEFQKWLSLPEQKRGVTLPPL
jgi:predicted metallo-beta-lactamase superfamily hydrolase